MALILEHRWEHALIADTVEVASTKCQSGYLGRTAIQKLLYFMYVLGVPMKYRFDIHHFGPFCQSILSDVEWLLADDVIVDQSQQQRYSNYRPGPAWDELKEKYCEKLDEYHPVVTNVCEALSDISPGTLELIATLDFSFRWVRAAGGEGPWKQDAIDKFKKIKGDKFPDEDIEKWYGTLAGSGLIEG